MLRSKNKNDAIIKSALNDFKFKHLFGMGKTNLQKTKLISFLIFNQRIFIYKLLNMFLI